ncbi:tryptophan--tRNA ligase [Candidatus Peribacteria bacterium]|nr:tryptophan--tRNA ligase [Candidatus Peribacteria bacterium]MBT4021086.1 tryptophan--tRNA ligase [Candidatus Peribacteria bacterium]MBT4240807.1 tryptophan--tRNA ligase [Candidatus Peribacteria bacterium]MBT4474164.1 tryptophan--tRNA ligase [Candidatus Peribacteria bacterium]
MRVLSGMQPSGDPHIGNYFGSIKPNIELMGEEENIYIVVDLHALTSVRDANELREYRMNLVKDLLACGFDPEKGILFFQSDVPEHAELLWILSCITPMGLLERAVSYKDKLAQGLEPNHGLFAYPVLQAADILLYDSDLIPVGKDQKQHIEMTRDIAQKFNNAYGDGVLKEPDVQIREDVAVVPGTDGRKMSKSYGNTIPLFADDKKTEKIIMGIVTDSKGVEEPKDPENCNVFKIHSLFLDDDGKKELEDKYRAGGLGYGDAKKMLAEEFFNYFGDMRKKRLEISDESAKEVVKNGAAKARKIAEKTMDRVRKSVGLR